MNTPGIKSLARALAFYERRQAVGANNMANVSTDGFKKIQLSAELRAGATGPLAVETLDLSPGTLKETGRALDLAIKGEGFFVVQTPAGERLTRGGSFSQSPDGLITDGSGALLLGERGPLPVMGGELTIDENGGVWVDGTEIDRLRGVTAAPASLTRSGANHFMAPAGAQVETRLRVHSGAVEEANIEAVTAMVDMIQTQRAHGSSLTAMRAIDESMATAVRLGRVI